MKRNLNNPFRTCILCIAATLVIALFMAAGIPQNAFAASKPKLSATKQSVTKGDIFTLTVKNINPKKAKVTVSSSKKGIVKLGKVAKKKSYDTIKITAKKKGSTTLKIKIKQSGKKTVTLTCKVMVETPKLSVTKKSLKAGSSFMLKLTGTNRKVTFTSSSKNLAIKKSSNQKVKVTAKKAGKYTVKAKLAKKTYTCKVTVSCSKHSYDKGKVTKAATCAKSGIKTYTCKDCGKIKTKTIKATGKHTYKLTSENAATCTENGKKTYTCIVCKKTKNETIAATGHTKVIDTNAVKATCTSTGFTEASHCSVCGEVIQTKEVTPMTEHPYNKGVVTKEATCTETGIKTYTCTVCSHTKEETIAMKPHNYETTVEKRYVVDMPAYDDDEYTGYEAGWIHYPCGFFTKDSDEINDHIGEFCINDPAGRSGYSNTRKPVYKTVHHEEVGHYEEVTTAVQCKDCGKQKQWVVDKEAYDEEVIAGYLHGWKHDSCDFFTTDLDEMHKHLVENCPDDLEFYSYSLSPSHPGIFYIFDKYAMPLKGSAYLSLGNQPPAGYAEYASACGEKAIYSSVIYDTSLGLAELPSDEEWYAYYYSPKTGHVWDSDFSTAASPVYVTIHHEEVGHFEE